MKRLLFIVCLASICLFSCTDDEKFVTIEENAFDEPTFRSGGDGKYDLLGYGCDPTNDFLLGKFRVVDNEKLIIAAPFAINPDETQQRREEIIADYTAESYLKSLTKSKGLGAGYGLGKASLTKSFTTTESYSVENSFASVQKFIQKKSFSYVIDPDFIIEEDCLSPEFKYALSKYDPQKIISKFGTHVYTNVRLGGVLELSYRAKVSKSSKERIKTTEAGASAAFKSIFNTDVKYSIKEQEEAIKETDNYSFVATARGGNVSLPLSKQEVKDLKVITVIDTKEWEESIGGDDGKGNSFIDFEPGTLIPLWEFVENADQREKLKSAIEEYLKANQYKDVEPLPVPFYQHFFNNGVVLDHYYSTDPISPTWYGNQGVSCYLYNVQVKGTIPLYHFYSGFLYNHYYSTYQGTPSSYSYQGIAGYIFAEQVDGTVPLYSFWVTDGKRFENDYYSTDPNTPSLYSRKKLVGYVYPKDYK